jgi:hypothetical protein
MPKCVALAKSYIGGKLCDEGDVVEVEGEIGHNLEAIGLTATEQEAADKAAADKAAKQEKQRKKRL